MNMYDVRISCLCVFVFFSVSSYLDDNDEKLCNKVRCENLQGKNPNQPGSLQQTLDSVKRPLSSCGENLVHLSSLGDEGLAGKGQGKEEERLSKKILDEWNKHGTKTKTSIARKDQICSYP